MSLLALSASFSASHCLSVRSPQLSSAYGPVRCPRVLSFCTCLAPRVLPLPAQGIVRLTAPYSTNEDAISRQASIAPGSYLPCYHDRHRIRTRPESGYDTGESSRDNHSICSRAVFPWALWAFGSIHALAMRSTIPSPYFAATNLQGLRAQSG